jgi:hypothetical protein
MAKKLSKEKKHLIIFIAVLLSPIFLGIYISFIAIFPYFFAVLAVIGIIIPTGFFGYKIYKRNYRNYELYSNDNIIAGVVLLISVFNLYTCMSTIDIINKGKRIEAEMAAATKQEAELKAKNFTDSINKAHVDYNKKNWLDAYSSYDSALNYGDLAPKDKEIFAGLIEKNAIKFVRTGDFEKAKSELARLLMLKPEDKKALELQEQVENQYMKFSKTDEKKLLQENIKDLEDNPISLVSLKQKNYILVTQDKADITAGKRSIDINIFAGAKKGDIFESPETVGDNYKIYMFSGEDRYINRSAARPIKYSEFKIDLPAEIAKQKEIIKDNILAQACADYDSGQQYPEEFSTQKKYDYQNMLTDRYKLEVMRKFNLKTAHLAYSILDSKANYFNSDSYMDYCGSPDRDRFK